MGKLLECITPEEAAFILRQPVYFIASAPNSPEQHVNLSPRAAGSSIHIVDNKTIAICDLSGSGSETVAHLLQNGRMTIMFVNLQEGPPKILRLFGHAQILLPSECDPELLDKFPTTLTSSPGFRAVYYVEIHRITSSCGYSMPIMKYEKHRTILDDYTNVKGKEGMEKYAILKNSFSIDALPSIAHLVNKDMFIESRLEDGYYFGHYEGESDDDDDDDDGEKKNETATTGQSSPSSNQFVKLLNQSRARAKSQGRAYSYQSKLGGSGGEGGNQKATTAAAATRTFSNCLTSSSLLCNLVSFGAGVLACQLFTRYYIKK